MVKHVIVVDKSGSMYSYLENIKTFLKAWVYVLVPDVALISFNQKVYIGSYYTSNPGSLSGPIDDITCGGSTGMHDAILCALAFENKCPDEIIVFSDAHDNCSCTDEANWEEKVNELGVDVWFYNLAAFDDAKLRPYTPLLTKRVIKPEEAMAKWEEMANRVKRVRIVKKPEDFAKRAPIKP
jgi:hypothetical protein